MNADDLQNLYSNLRGSRSAQSVLDAYGLFAEQKMGQALVKLADARDMYQQSRARLLRDPPELQVDAGARNADQQIKRIQQKQRKALNILETFEQFLRQLEKLAQREQPQQNKTSSDDESECEADASPDQPDDDAQQSESQSPDQPEFATSSDVTGELAAAFRQATGEDKLDVISAAFGFREVRSPKDIHPHALYVIRTDEDSFSLVYTLSADQLGHTIYLENAAGNQPISPYSRKAFVSLGTSHEMVLLTPKTNACVKKERDATSDESAETGRVETERGDDQQQDTAGQSRRPTHSVLDMGAFSQLMDSAQRSGIVPGADRIAHVRDREFRKGDYDLALQLIEAMYATFTANANQRNQRLTREEADISSGRVKMSPKQLQAKRARDRMQTQAVERARNRFQRVLDGLRILLRTA